MTMTERYEVYKALVERALDGYFQPQKDGADGLRQAMRYSLMAGGKRIRPVLCLEFCRVCGGETEKCLPVACGVEMLHTYSLIHDDLPCMDDDDQRRGMPTNHKRFGETTAVLAGDCLQAEAFGAICRADIGSTARERCCRILSRAAGLSGICGGQFMDLNDGTASVEMLTDTDMGKTASLMGAACAMGAAAAGAPEEMVENAWTYGVALGMAFQCRDDVLDRDGFYTLLGSEACQSMTEQYTAQALDCLEAFSDAVFLRWLTGELSGRSV
jgi:geranylgeranyl diphosphate synthase type II